MRIVGPGGLAFQGLAVAWAPPGLCHEPLYGHKHPEPHLWDLAVEEAVRPGPSRLPRTHRCQDLVFFCSATWGRLRRHLSNRWIDGIFPFWQFASGEWKGKYFCAAQGGFVVLILTQHNLWRVPCVTTTNVIWADSIQPELSSMMRFTIISAHSSVSWHVLRPGSRLSSRCLSLQRRGLRTHRLLLPYIPRKTFSTEVAPAAAVRPGRTPKLRPALSQVRQWQCDSLPPLLANQWSRSLACLRRWSRFSTAMSRGRRIQSWCRLRPSVLVPAASVARRGKNSKAHAASYAI